MNLGEEMKLNLMSRAKICIHPMKYEHFGIAVVEAMAVGLISIVHKYSGAQSDIVNFGKYGFGFIEELIEMFGNILLNN